METARRELLNGKEAAQLLRCTAAALARWRRIGGGPAYVKVGRLVRYQIEDLASWVEGRRVEGSEPSMRLITSPDGKQ